MILGPLVGEGNDLFDIFRVVPNFPLPLSPTQVLSVIAQQLITIQCAKRAHVRFSFLISFVLG